ncbi:AMP-binding protein [Streptomyces sp. NBC_00893]|uniref:AMP-binding protein n=1 Tax=Streptomyces sp. NBC_00893 TaxID=2975862 RepID=UPI00224D59EF|nr:AMP-binding protein [Streptomyces sp. NBC_00893]MCX4849528.1 AMP-binding protein [Streptomyces sp. NBC_00893]
MTALKREVCELLGVPGDRVGDTSNLFELGLGSLQLLRLTSRFVRSGAPVSYAVLARDARLATWHALLNSGAGPAGPDEQEGSIPVSGAPAQAPDTGQPHVRRDPHQPFALTPVQQAYWIGRGEDRSLGGVGCHVYLEVDSPPLEPERLERAVHALHARHPMLRARFTEWGTQRVADTSAWPGLTVYDHRRQPWDDIESAVLKIRTALSHRRLEVSRGEVLDVQLSRLPDAVDRIHINVDLLACDIQGIRLLLDDLAVLYDEPAALAELSYTFPQYLADRANDRAEERERDRQYWRRRLPELPGGPGIPLAVEPDDVVKPRFVRCTHELTWREWATLRARASEHGITPAALLATAFAEILGRWSEKQHFLLNVPISERDRSTHPEADRIIGDFTGLVLLEIDLTSGAGFAQRARAVQRQLHEDIGHSAYTGIDVLRDMIREDGDASRAAPVVFTCNTEAPLVPDAFAERFGELSWMVSQVPQVWLSSQAYGTRDGGVLLAWDAVEELFPDGLLDAMMSAQAALLRDLAALDWSGRPAVELPAAQRKRRADTGTEPRREPGRMLHQTFFERSCRRADAPALLWGTNGTLSHRDLADQALRIARSLRDRGVGRGDTVIVSAATGPQQIAAVLGVLAAGGTYVPTGADQPAEPQECIVRASGARLVLEGTGAPPASTPYADVLSVRDALLADPLDAPVSGDPDDIAYAAFALGCSGTPALVEVTHRAAVHTVEDIGGRFGIGPRDRVLGVSAPDSGLAVWDLFGPLTEGGALVLVGEADRRDAFAWLALCERHAVTVWNSVPALMDVLLAVAESEGLPRSLRLALLSGDWRGADLQRWLRAATHGRCRLVGLGGVAETVIWANTYEMRFVPAQWRSVPYIKPLPSQKFRVVDPQGRDSPDWVPGELWVGGEGLALRYRGDPALTAERFCEVAGERWFRTGGTGRYWPDGSLEFLGRMGQRVRIDGMPVELDEIETVLQEHPQIARSVVVPVGERRRELVAAVVRPKPPAGIRGAADTYHTRVPADDCSALSLEHAVTETVLTSHVADYLRYHPGPLAVRSMLVAEDRRAQVALWLDYLTERGVLRASGEVLTAGSRWAEVRDGRRAALLREEVRDTPLERTAQAWSRALPQLRTVFMGETSPAVLRDDPDLSPEHLCEALDGARASIAAVSRELAVEAEHRIEPLVVAEWAGMSGGSALRLLDELPPGSVDFTLLDPSETRLADAQVRLTSAGHVVKMLRQNAVRITEGQLHRYDAVLLNDVISRTPYPQATAAALSMVLKPGGRLHLLTRVAASPLALLTAGASPEPLAPAGADEWAEVLTRVGLTEVKVAREEPDGVVLVQAVRTSTHGYFDTRALRSWLADRLPTHMIPGTIVGLPMLSLTRNRELDRRRVRQLLTGSADHAQAHGDPPRGSLENEVAALWAQSLGVPVTGRDTDFFLNGGDSLLAVRLTLAIRRRLGVELTMPELLRVPTVAAMSALVEGRRGPFGRRGGEPPAHGTEDDGEFGKGPL